MSLLQPFYAPFFKATDNDGLPLVGGKLYTYAAGTTNPLATYTDAGGSVAQTNPVVLDDLGQALIFLGSNIYKFVLKDASDATLWTADDISAVRVTDASSITGVLSLSQIPDFPLSRVAVDINPDQKFYYQDICIDAVGQPQRPILNFSRDFQNFTDGSSNVSLKNTGVAAGAYVNANITVDVTGRITAAASNPFIFPARVDDSNGSSQALPSGTIDKWGTSAACPTGVPKGTVSVTFPGGPFTTVPSVVCSPDSNPDGSNLDPIECHPTNITVNGFIANFTADVLIGGSGAGNINNSVHCCWHAKGH